MYVCVCAYLYIYIYYIYFIICTSIYSVYMYNIWIIIKITFRYFKHLLAMKLFLDCPTSLSLTQSQPQSQMYRCKNVPQMTRWIRAFVGYLLQSCLGPWHKWMRCYVAGMSEAPFRLHWKGKVAADLCQICHARLCANEEHQTSHLVSTLLIS